MAIRMEIKILNLKKKKKPCLITITFAIQTFISSFEKILYEPNGYVNMQWDV